MGHARVGGTTSELARRIRRGDIAVVDHADLDGESARALIAAGAAGLVDVSPVLTGRYPATGAALLTAAGVAVLDTVGSEVLALVPDGARVRLDGDSLWYGEKRVGSGRVIDASRAGELVDESRLGLGTQAAAFSGAVADLLRTEADLLLDPAELPTLATSLAERDVLVVAAGSSAHAELRALRRFVRDRAPVVIGVGAGAEVARAAGLAPAVVVTGGSAGPQPAGEAGGAERVRVVAAEALPAPEAGAGPDPEPTHLLRTQLGAEEVAVLLAVAGRARLVVLAGAAGTLAELLDRDSSPVAIAATVLARLQVGTRLMPAGAVARLHEPVTTPARGVLTGVAAVLALVLGLAVGGGAQGGVLDRVIGSGDASTPSGGPAAATTDPAQAQSLASLQGELDRLQRSAASTAGWLGAVTPALVADRLHGHRVVMIALPGADPGALAAAAAAVEAAGAELAGTLSLAERLFDPDRLGSVDDLLGRLDVDPGEGAEAEPAGRVAAALARSVLTRSSAQLGRPSDQATAVLAGLAQLEVLTVDGAPDRRADLAVLVAGDRPTAGDAAAGDPSLARRLVAALGESGRGVVLVGPSAPDRLVGQVRASGPAGGEVSTLEGLDGPTGPGTLVLALAEALAGGSGHYGGESPTGVVPMIQPAGR